MVPKNETAGCLPAQSGVSKKADAENESMGAVIFRKTIPKGDPCTLSNVLASHSGLSKMRVKRAMNLGAAWLQRSGGPMRRVRRAGMVVKPGDKVALYYDEEILNRLAPTASCMRDLIRYSIWYKPSGLMTQGTRFGDHCSLVRQAELYFTPSRPILPVHRIDREVAGLIIMAHDRKAAARLSERLRTGRIEKHYMVWVRGDLYQRRDQGRIDLPLDDRPASTRYDILEYDRASDQSRARVHILNGRLHQIRRHFNLIGHPVIGDPRYGTGNKNQTGMCLTAYALAFECPFGNGRIAMEFEPQNMDVNKPSSPSSHRHSP
jgi:tRNA pseudouridine32 synthase / 23S rRNA pseudouridine746 synthase